MREVTGSTASFQTIILFILIFAAFLSMVIIYSKAYIIKNEALTIIEKYDGVSNTSLDIINNYVLGQGYKQKGSCPADESWIGVKSISKKDYEAVKDNTKYYYCFQKVEKNSKSVYYNIRFFYKFNLPVFGDIATFKINGRTKLIIPANDIIKEV